MIDNNSIFQGTVVSTQTLDSPAATRTQHSYDEKMARALLARPPSRLLLTLCEMAIFGVALYLLKMDFGNATPVQWLMLISFFCAVKASLDNWMLRRRLDAAIVLLQMDRSTPL